MESPEVCINFTQNCNNHGDCVQDDDKLWYCDCASRWDPKTNCTVNFYQEYHLRDLGYPISQSLLVLFVLVILVLEINVDIRVKKRKRLWRSNNFITKLFLLSICLLRQTYLTEEFWRSITENMSQLELFETIIYNLSIYMSLACYSYVLASWIDIITRIKGMTKEQTTYLKKVQKILFLMLFIFIIPSFVLSILSSANVAMDLTWTLSISWSLVYLLILIVWSSYQIYQMKKIIDLSVLCPLFILQLDNKRGRLIITRKKNKIIALGNILLFLVAISVIIYFVTDAKNGAWSYFIFNTITRTLEHLALVAYLFVVELYFTKYHFTAYCRWNEIKDPEVTNNKTYGNPSIVIS